MEIALESGSLLELETPLLLVNVFEDSSEWGGSTALSSEQPAVRTVDQALGGMLQRLMECREIRGELGEFAEQEGME
jgi:hypothetical protein